MSAIEEVLLDKNKYGEQLLIDCHSSSDIEIAGFNKYYTSNFYEIHLIESGSVNMHIGNLKMELKQNMLLFLTPSKIRHWEPTGEMKGKILIFESGFVEHFFKDNFFLYKLQYFQNAETLPYIQLSVDDLNQYKILFSEIENEIIALETDSQHLIRAALFYLLVKLNRHYSTHYNIKDSFVISNTLVLRFLKLLDKTTGRKGVQEYANELGVSKTHLNNVLKMQFNCTALYLINSKLIEQSKKELLFSKKNISEVGFEIGFSETSNFVRFFKNQTGTTPSDFVRHFSK
ncbi:MAG: hypothetical protein DRJ05_15385 [Bacteroidetes bacterium]|nr:MAG: hypothetical protein DRJ05_15385 [Bacteroidota bacterium]